MSAYTIAWIAWMAIFGVVEGLALFNKKPGDTLSEHVWKWFAIKTGKRSDGWRRTILAMGLLWLALHFLTGGMF